MNKLTDFAKPGLMISQTWPTSREKEGATLEAVEIVLEDDFFLALQTVEVPNANERKQIAQLVAEKQIPLTYTLTRVLNDNHLNLSGLDKSNRKQGVEKIIECLDDAREIGATSVGLVSGPGPEKPEKRMDALNCLEESLFLIGLEAMKIPPIKVVIEPLDFAAHKKAALGKTEEAIWLSKRLKKSGIEVGLCLDTAHMLLNEEDLDRSIADAKPFLSEYHYCNCVTDPAHSLYGDYHLPFGSPGVMNAARIATIMKRSLEIGFFNPVERPLIFCEVLKRKEDNSIDVMANCGTILQEAWKLSKEL